MFHPYSSPTSNNASKKASLSCMLHSSQCRFVFVSGVLALASLATENTKYLANRHLININSCCIFKPFGQPKYSSTVLLYANLHKTVWKTPMWIYWHFNDTVLCNSFNLLYKRNRDPNKRPWTWILVFSETQVAPAKAKRDRQMADKVIPMWSLTLLVPQKIWVRVVFLSITACVQFEIDVYENEVWQSWSRQFRLLLVYSVDTHTTLQVTLTFDPWP